MPLTLEKLTKYAAEKPPLKCHAVAVPEWGDEAYIAELTAEEVDVRVGRTFTAYREKHDQEDNAGLRAYLAAACLCNSQLRDFMATDEDDIHKLAAMLGQLESTAVGRLSDKAQTVNGITETDEDIEKNSTTCGDGNGTSPSTQDSAALVSGSAA